MFKLIFILCFAFQFSAFAQPSEPPKDSRAYERLAVKAYQAKDFPVFLENMKQADSLNPNHPRITYNLAVAYNLNGKTNEAMASLNKLAEMKLFYRIDKDESFDSLKSNPEFQNLVKKFADNSNPINHAQTAFTINEKGLVTESVAYDEKTKNFYLASIAQRKILKVNEKGETTVFADKSSGLWSVAGMKIDAKNRILWAASASHKQMPDLQTGEDGMTGVFKFDLKTGKLIKKYVVSNQPKAHWLGDLAIAPNGDVYATDSISPTIYVIRKDKDEIEVFTENSAFGSPQGLDFSADGKFLLMADYSKGIFKINLSTKEVTKIIPAENTAMLGIDGLYFYQNSIIATQNGVNPQRVIKLQLSKDLSKIEKFEILEANNPLFDEITLGTIIGNQFYFIANSQWNALGDGGKLAAPEKLKELNVLKLKL
jgi:WD40 repeat protein